MGVDSKAVSELPSGFIPLPLGNEESANGLHYVPWESQISFMDADECCIYQTGFTNSDFIVKFRNEYYVNEEKYLELIEIAGLAAEEHLQTHNFNEVVEIRGAAKTVYDAKVLSLEAVATEPFGDDILTTYHINYTVTPTVSENQRIIVSVETKQGVTYSNLDYIDKETLSVQIRERGGDDIVAVILGSPDYPGLTYRVMAYSSQK
jgi:hypothetical protein